jgi:hypothetical protein
MTGFFAQLTEKEWPCCGSLCNHFEDSVASENNMFALVARSFTWYYPVYFIYEGGLNDKVYKTNMTLEEGL